MDIVYWLIAILLLVSFLIVIGVKNKKRFFKNENVLKGIVLVLGVAGLFALFTQCAKADWFNYVEMSVGLDYTKGVSPQCEEGGESDRWTSNINLTGNVWRYGGLEINGRYTHHSCAIGEDRNGYDAIGPELRYRKEF